MTGEGGTWAGGGGGGGWTGFGGGGRSGVTEHTHTQSIDLNTTYYISPIFTNIHLLEPEKSKNNVSSNKQCVYDCVHMHNNECVCVWGSQVFLCQ